MRTAKVIKNCLFSPIGVALLCAGVMAGGASEARAASFSVLNSHLPDVGDGAAAWGDVDNDGDMDLVLAGSATWGGYGSTWLYRNDGAGNFVEAAAGLPGMIQGDLAFADVDRDGDLDLVMSGWFGDNNGGRSTVLFHNDGSGDFQPSGVGLMPMRLGVVSWADYNNDGWLDLLLAGETNTGNMVVYSTRPMQQRLDGTFRQSFFLLPKYVNSIISHSTAAWGDYDNDGDADLLLATSISGTGFLFANEGSYFTRFSRSAAFDPPGAWIEAAVFADLDNDGWLDIVTGGRDAPAAHRNLGTNAFAAIAGAITNAQFLALGVGDFDHDGRVDLVYAGNDQASATGGLLRNTGNGVFATEDLVLPPFTCAQVLPADINNDGRLDFLVTGRQQSAGTTALYRNETPGSNTPPLAPSGLETVITNEWITFSWQPAGDADQAGGLTYNLRAGTAPGRDNLVAAMSAPDGNRRLPQPGNAGLRRSARISLERLPPGRIYWSVQAVDHGYAGSPFAPDQTAEIPPTLTLSIRMATNGQSEILLQGLPWRTYRVEVSTNLIDWTTWQTTSFFTGTAIYPDPESGGMSQRFFRARLLP